MDKRLFNAASLGDVVELQNILKENPRVLEKVSEIPFAKTPLHVATLVGKYDFVMEIIKLMPSFAKARDEMGLTPIHIASAKGYSKIVSELLKLELDANLCLVKDNLGRTPLHYASAKGRVDVIEILISVCPLSLVQVTLEDNNVLHHSMHHYRFEHVKILVERLKELDISNNLFYLKDKEGCAFLDLVEAKKPLEVIDLLKEKGITGVRNARESNNTVVGEGWEKEYNFDSGNFISYYDLSSCSESSTSLLEEGD